MSPTKFYPEVYCDVRFDPVGKSWLDLEKFLNHREPEKLRPSNVVNWRRMQNRIYLPEYGEEERRDEGEREIVHQWNEIVRFNRYDVTAQTIAELSNGYVLPGKWDIHGDLDELHVLWDKMCRALYEGKTFPPTCPGAIYMEKRMRPDKTIGAPAIRVLSGDWRNAKEIKELEKVIRSFGVTQRLFYKPEIYTTLNINSGNDFKISPVTYISTWKEELGKSIVVKRF